MAFGCLAISVNFWISDVLLDTAANEQQQQQQQYM